MFFLDNQMDRRTLDLISKSMSSEDIEKSLNRSGLVQVERTVMKLGTTPFRQKFWVRPDQVRKTDTVLHGKPQESKLTEPQKPKISQEVWDSVNELYEECENDDEFYRLLDTSGVVEGISWDKSKDPKENLARAKFALAEHWEHENDPEEDYSFQEDEELDDNPSTELIHWDKGYRPNKQEKTNAQILLDSLKEGVTKPDYTVSITKDLISQHLKNAIIVSCNKRDVMIKVETDKPFTKEMVVDSSTNSLLHRICTVGTSFSKDWLEGSFKKVEADEDGNTVVYFEIKDWNQEYWAELRKKRANKLKGYVAPMTIERTFSNDFTGIESIVNTQAAHKFFGTTPDSKEEEEYASRYSKYNRLACTAYTNGGGDYSGNLNGFARGWGRVDDENGYYTHFDIKDYEGMKILFDNLDEAIGKSVLSKPLMVHRVVSADNAGTDFEGMLSKILNPNSEFFKEEGYCSTTVVNGTMDNHPSFTGSQRIKMNIKLPAGEGIGMWIAPFAVNRYKWENEFLLGRGMQFHRLTDLSKIDKNADVIEVDLEVVGQQAPSIEDLKKEYIGNGLLWDEPDPERGRHKRKLDWSIEAS